MCFAWAVLSALYSAKKNPKRLSIYSPYLNSIDLTGLAFPVPVYQLTRFERNNPTISINVFSLGDDERELIPKFVTKCGNREKHINLLLLTSKTSDNCHYCWIKTWVLSCIRERSITVRHTYVHTAYIRFHWNTHSKTTMQIVQKIYIKCRQFWWTTKGFADLRRSHE